MSSQRNLDGTYGEDQGYIYLEDIDKGLIVSLGGSIVVDADGERKYAVSLPSLEANMPIVFENPEQVLISNKVPCIVILRDDIDLSYSPRWRKGEYDYRLPTVNAEEASIHDTTGYTAYRVKPVKKAVTISYTIQMYHISRHKINIMLQKVIECILQKEYITIVDSKGYNHLAGAYLDNPSKLDDFASVVNRILGFALPLKVDAWIDTWPEQYENDIVTQDAIFRRNEL